MYIRLIHINQLLGWFASSYVTNGNVQNLNPHLFTWNVNQKKRKKEKISIYIKIK